MARGFAQGVVLRGRAALRVAATRAGGSEHAEQVALFAWVERAALTAHPVLALLYAVPNGGHRHKLTAVRMKREGVRAGVPDLCLPVARGAFHALYIELKRRAGGRVSHEQRWWIDRLTTAGNCVRVCHGWDEARAVLEWYLGLPVPRAGERPS